MCYIACIGEKIVGSPTPSNTSSCVGDNTSEGATFLLSNMEERSTTHLSMLCCIILDANGRVHTNPHSQSKPSLLTMVEIGCNQLTCSQQKSTKNLDWSRWVNVVISLQLFFTHLEWLRMVEKCKYMFAYIQSFSHSIGSEQIRWFWSELWYTGWWLTMT